MTTAARTTTRLDAHWYFPDGNPCYELPKADGKGVKSPTLADARKLNLRPSVTTVQKMQAKPELVNWIVEQAVLAVVTTPRKPGEPDDAFVRRVLHDEKVQDQERDTAAEKGKAIHDACELYFMGQDVPPDVLPWISPAVKALCAYGSLVCTERVLVGDGYAGRTDLILESPECWWLWDFKSTKNLPDPKKGAWNEHKIQLAAYAAAWKRIMSGAGASPVTQKNIRTGNCYISTIEQGKFVLCPHEPDWERWYSEGFVSLMRLWRLTNNYYPQ